MAQRIILILIIAAHTVHSTAPADHLVPPPQVLTRVTIPGIKLPQSEPPGFMQRIARWLGFGQNPKEQQLQASYQYPQYKEPPHANPYQYHRPKALCNPCNKVPWIPMFPGNLQYPLVKGHFNQPASPQIKFNHLQNNNNYNGNNQHISLSTYSPPLQPVPQQYAPAYTFQPPHVQRAVKFNHPSPNAINNLYLDHLPSTNVLSVEKSPIPQKLAPIPVPNLSATPIPPLYDATPFNKDVVRPNRQQPPLNLLEIVDSQNNAVHNQNFPPNFKPLDGEPSFEIVQSVPVTDFVSSVEYPANIIQSQVIDLSQQQQNQNQHQQNQHQQNQHQQNQHQQNQHQQNQHQQNQHQQNQHQQNEQQLQDINHQQQLQHEHLQELQQQQFQQQEKHNQEQQLQLQHQQQQQQQQQQQYQEQQQYLDQQHQQQQIQESANEHPKLIELGTFDQISQNDPIHQTPDYLSDPIIVHNHNTEPDNYPEASSHNISYNHENHIEPIGYVNPPTEIFLPTIPSTIRPTEGTTSDHTTVEIIPSVQTASWVPTSSSPVPRTKDRETPRKLLDSPILYMQGSSPRPFTRDPSDLRVRSSTYEYNLWQPSPTPTPWIFAPTPTSTYSSSDASGHWAGISPPSQFQPNPAFLPPQPSEKRPKQIHQIIIPYTTKNKPSPFKPRDEQNDQPIVDSRYSNWANSQEIDQHEQQESKLVTATEPPLKKSTKYLTKILASNIRELLKKEHEHKNKTKPQFDFSKLQKNIDDWTEQEFTSLAHKASTASLYGRSKNIPNEYLTTTPTIDETTVDTTEEPPITTTYISLLDENEIQKYDFLSQFIESNQIGQLEYLKDPSTTTTTTTTTSTTTTESPPISPFYVRTVPPTQSLNELWNRLKVSISPQTKEKVYVVTPQPVFQQKTTTDSIGTFKSPRFLVRPTPGSGFTQISTTSEKSSTPGYTPQLFGLMGISAYIPPAPVETLDGHSKVITVVTPSSNKQQSPEEEETSSTNLASSQSASSNNTTTTTAGS